MKDVNFGERLNAAKNAKRAMTAKFHQRPSPDDPAVAERRAARAALSAAREARLAEREATRVAVAADRERQAAEAAANEAAAAERAAATEAAEAVRAAAEKAASDADRELKLKAARDARYAARKARK